MIKFELDVNTEVRHDEAPIHVATHTEESARPYVEAGTRRWLEGLGLGVITFEIKRVFGPAGGASVIEFTAPDRLTARRLITAYAGDAENAKWMIEEYLPA